LKYINLISGPRNISTALMYSFAQRSDTVVLDEPFYAVYLSKSRADHPGTKEVLASQSIDEHVVLQQIFGEWPKAVMFIKNMAHHIELLDKAFLEKVTNVFLIRNPRQIIASYAEVIHEPQMRDIGIQYECELFEQLKRNGGSSVVIDSGYVVENPAGVLKKLCNAVGIPFEESMLKWPAGPKAYDGVWAPHWYANVHGSTGFEKQKTSSRPLPERLHPLCDRAAHYYEKLLTFAIQPD
jgi:hypothetical protein